jgi:lipopolysaccharide transport system ATP-binding protein
MSDTVVKVENLGKKFLIGHQKNGDLRQAFGDSVKRWLGNGVSKKEEFWALKDVNFEIKQGEVVGIIGRNGAGKSTLLKILSRITEPTTGRFEINGRMSSLLEVGTGFHPELTGRENIYLNGTILGMRRGEVKSKFDEIVAFSGVENFLDTPVKHYSSGMKVRLAFSVAAHLEPEILIIDEVLAVGDAEFQKKCLRKVDDVSKKEGRTILFVSHNLAAIGQLCNRGILLKAGGVSHTGDVSFVVHHYLIGNKSNGKSTDFSNADLRKGSGEFKVKKITLLNEYFQPISLGRTGNPLVFELELDKDIRCEKNAFRIDLAIDSELDTRVAWFSSDVVRNEKKDAFRSIQLRIPKFCLASGTYFLTFYITWKGNVVDYIHQAFSFDVEEGDFFGTGKVIPKSQTFIYTDHEIVYR